MVPHVRRALRVFEVSRILLLGATTVTVGLLAACGGDGGTTEPEPPSVASVSVSPGSVSLVPDQTRELSATPRDGNNNALTGRAVTWSSDEESVATVNSAGVVTGEGPGSTTIRAASEGRVGTATVTVNDGGFVGAAGGTVTAAGGDVVLTIPAGALTTGTALTVGPLANPPAHPRLIAGTGYELGPNGTTFAQPVTVRIAYTQASVGGADENQLTVHRWNGTAWVPLASGAVDTGANTASGQTSQFSPFAVIEIVPNPVPTLASLAPTSAEEGGAAFTLTVTGTGFIESSAVRWNGVARTTTFQSATTLTAQITAADIAAAGQAAVTVFSPAPGGGTTAPLAFPILPPPPPQTTFTVTTTANGGAGSLRQAILDANANPGADLIHFEIPGAGPHTIMPTSALPIVTDPVTIDGLTQPGASCDAWPATLQIELRGSSAGTGSHGLTLSGGNSTVRGLVINRFIGGAGIRVDSDANSVACNYIGTDVSGTMPVDAPSFDANQAHGVLIDGGDNNMIGGTTPSSRNLLSGSSRPTPRVSGNGVQLQGSATGNVIAGNYIGTNATGTAVLGNRNAGVYIGGAPGNRIGGDDHDAGVCNRSCNLISGNEDSGIEVWGDGGDDTVIQGNFIGVNLAGTTSLANKRYGIMIDMGAGSIGHRGHVIGGKTAAGVCSGPCNLISGNQFHGIRIDDVTVRDLTTQGNFIGTDVTGMAALPNGDGGIKSEGKNHLIGGSAAGLGNLISGNTGFIGAGLELQGEDHVVQGNIVGAAIDGVSPLGNAGVGVRVTRINKLVGGTGAGEGNIIAHNGDAGILYVESSGTVSNGPISFLGNSIYANSGLGINLCKMVNFACDGVTENDLGDADTGPNNLQNFPVLSAATVNGMLSVTGTLNSTPSTTFRVEFFANDALDPSGHGEGQTYLGFEAVTTDGSGDASIAVMLPSAGVTAGNFITATATHPDGSTSEFSAGIVVQ